MIKAVAWFHATEERGTLETLTLAVKWLEENESIFLWEHGPVKTKCSMRLSMVGKACKAEFRGYAR